MQPFLFSIFLAVRCVSWNADDLFGDDDVDFRENLDILHDPADAMSPPYNDAYEPSLLAVSPNHYAESFAGDFLFTEVGDSDPGDPAALPLLLGADPSPAPLGFHDDPPGAHNLPECEFPRLAACCAGGDMRDCIWYRSLIDPCTDSEYIYCCEEVTKEGQGRNCVKMVGLAEYWIERFMDMLRTPIPLPVWNGGGWVPDG
jgi:hypothetical protein